MSDEKNVVAAERLPAVQTDVNAKDLAFCSSAEALKKLTYQQALSFRVLPLSIIRLSGDEILTLVSGTPIEQEDLQALRFLCGCTLRVIRCDETVLTEAIFIAYRSDQSSITQTVTKLAQTEPRLEVTESSIPFQEDSVPGLLKKLIEVGTAKGGSDLTLIPEENGAIQATIRIDGRVQPFELPHYSSGIHRTLLNRVRVLSELAVGERNTPQDGRFSVELPHGQAEVRFHIFPTIFGEKICFRLPVTRTVPELSALGLTAETLRYLEGVLKRLEGAVFLSGPTGSGKTTTLYSILTELTKRELTIVSLEDPVEQRISGVSQTDISKLPNVTYARGLREVLRQDPDVILVGEIRDSESARTALEAASTGQMVLSTVHGGRACHVLERLVRLSGDRALVAQATSLVIGQRLLPKLCAKCKVIDLASSKRFGRTLYQPAQCGKCEYTGYSGRSLVDESLFMAPEIEQLLKSGDLTEQRLQHSPYYRSIMHALERALVSGVLDLQTAQRVVPLG